jgi:hypothetical protein
VGNRWRFGRALLCVALLTGCYHQVVTTGLPAGDTRIAKPWTATWIFGLVPATPLDVRAQCPNGVATVDTKMTFLNGLVTALTIGIFTPRSVTVTCAGSGSASNAAARLDVAAGAGEDAVQEALSNAAALSTRLGAPVLVDWGSGAAATTLTR